MPESVSKGVWGDNVDVPTWREHTDHTNWLKELNKGLGWHEGRLNDHDGKIADLYKKEWEDKRAYNQRMDNIDKRIQEVCKRNEARIGNLPQEMRNIFSKVLKETLTDQLTTFAGLLEQLREERKHTMKQLADLQKLCTIAEEKSKKAWDELSKFRTLRHEADIELEKLKKEYAEAEKRFNSSEKERAEQRQQLESVKEDCAEQCEKIQKLEDNLNEVRGIGEKLKKDFPKLIDTFKELIPIPRRFVRFLFVKKNDTTDSEN